MKLRRSQVRTSKRTGEPFYRYLISPPPEVIEALGWEPGDDLECKVQDGRLVIWSIGGADPAREGP